LTSMSPVLSIETLQLAVQPYICDEGATVARYWQSNCEAKFTSRFIQRFLVMQPASVEPALKRPAAHTRLGGQVPGRDLPVQQCDSWRPGQTDWSVALAGMPESRDPFRESLSRLGVRASLMPVEQSSVNVDCGWLHRNGGQHQRRACWAPDPEAGIVRTTPRGPGRGQNLQARGSYWMRPLRRCRKSEGGP